MPRLDISDNKFLDFDRSRSSNISLVKKGVERPLQLNIEQAFQMWISLDVIEAEAERHWALTNTKDEYKHHLGWNVFLSVVCYKDKLYFDIRQFWMPRGSTKLTPTKSGIRLNRDESQQLRNYKTIISASIPEMEMVEPCDCWSKSTMASTCERCFAST